MRAFALERQHRVDHVLDHAGAGDLAVLGDVADENDGRAGSLGKADERLRRAAHLGHRAGRGLDHVRPHGLDGIDDDEAGRLALRERGDDVLNRGFRREFDRGVAEPEPLGAQPHLRHGLFAGDVDGAVAGAGERRGGLNQQGRFADAGVAGHQQHRAADEAAAGDAVEFRQPGRQAGGLMGLADQRLERELAALAWSAARAGRAAGDTAGAVAFLDHGVPLAAGLAFALPAGRGRAAVLADEGQVAAGH